MRSIRIIFALSSISLLILFVSVAGYTQDKPVKFKKLSYLGLKDYYKAYFPIGVAISPQTLQTDEAEFIVKQFSSITPENAMKMGPLHPTENEYFWDDADKLVEFAEAHSMKIRGHALCWHQQTPDWMFKDQNGKQVSKEVLLERLKKHITKVVSRYKGRIYAWDVVNEAVADESGRVFRDSPWFRICGEDFIAKAFEYAHAADPNAQLFYNDYNTEQPLKRDKVYTLLKKLIEAGVPIHGLGLQAHWNLVEPSEQNLRDALDKYASLGVKIQITELDISVHPWVDPPRDKRPDESDLFSPEMEQLQKEMYVRVFNVFREYKDKITGVTFWNVSDRYSWLDFYPVNGRKNYPLLFDKNLEPKQAYWEVVNFKKE